MEFRAFFDAGFQIGNYPIWDESYRAVLNEKIKRHYYFREIGQETPGRFKFYLDTKMNEIMPYYNQLYETTLKNYDIDVVSHTTETYLGTLDGESSATTENTSSATSENSATTENTSSSTDISSSSATSDTSTHNESESAGTSKNTGTTENKVEYGSKTETVSDGVYSLSDSRELDTPEGSLSLIDGQLNPGYLTKANTNRTEQGGSTTAEHTGTDTTTSTDDTQNETESTSSADTDTTTSAETSAETSSDTTATSSSTATAETNADSTAETTATSKSTNEYLKEIIVRNPNLAVSTIEKLRGNILNIDMLIIRELNELFMQIF